MKVFDYDASVNIELKILEEKENESYIAKYEITRDDESTVNGACMNQPTKEDIYAAVEEAVTKILKDENHHWD